MGVRGEERREGKLVDVLAAQAERQSQQRYTAGWAGNQGKQWAQMEAS
jgi:hypothetical protein